MPTPVWTPTMAWDVTKAITKARLNQYIGNDGVNPGNLEYLLNRPNVQANASTTTSSTSFVDVNAALNLNFTMVSGCALIILTIRQIGSGTGGTYTVDFLVDGTSVSGASGVGAYTNSPQNYGTTIFYLKSGLSAGSHAFKPQHKISTGTSNSTLYTFTIIEIG